MQNAKNLEVKFSELSVKASRLLFLVPSVLCSDNAPDLNNTIEVYSDDLPFPELAASEIVNWRQFITEEKNNRGKMLIHKQLLSRFVTRPFSPTHTLYYKLVVLYLLGAVFVNDLSAHYVDSIPIIGQP
ncbi:unnamed protein product [Owenia fusiformis]|uniref:Uncharacterized protein n=1 Tax=Owenia fusiformis TaxID=6347 RepID=A0A8S4NB58_OWEFU|nr:unnamed protein product [Owenia fusiformis]